MKKAVIAVSSLALLVAGSAAACEINEQELRRAGYVKTKYSKTHVSWAEDPNTGTPCIESESIYTCPPLTVYLAWENLDWNYQILDKVGVWHKLIDAETQPRLRWCKDKGNKQFLLQTTSHKIMTVANSNRKVRWAYWSGSIWTKNADPVF